MTAITITAKVPYTRYSQVPAWDEHYELLPGTYEVYSQEYHKGYPFDAIKARVEVVCAKKFVLWGGVAYGKGQGPDKGEIVEIEIPVKKIPPRALGA